METNITAKQYKKALEDRKVFIVGTKFTKSGWTQFRVYRIYNNQPQRIIVKDASYWNEKAHAYKCVAWGTDRRLEVILSIGYSLGLKFSDIRQNYHWFQDNFN